MPRFVVAPAAEQDIIAIGTYVARRNPSAAAKLVNDIYSAFSRLAERPDMGHSRRDLTALPVRFWAVRQRYLIVYRGTAPIEVARVLSGYRDVASVLGLDAD